MIEVLKYTGIIVVLIVLVYVLWRIFVFGFMTSYFQAKFIFIKKLKELKKGGHYEGQ